MLGSMKLRKVLFGW